MSPFDSDSCFLFFISLPSSPITATFLSALFSGCFSRFRLLITPHYSSLGSALIYWVSSYHFVCVLPDFYLSSISSAFPQRRTQKPSPSVANVFRFLSPSYPHSPSTKTRSGSEQLEFKSISSNYHIQSLENGSLVIKDVEEADGRQYVCEAINGVGVDLSAAVHLTVNVPPRFKDPFRVVRLPIGKPLTVACQPHGHTPIEVKWTKDDNDIDLMRPKET